MTEILSKTMMSDFELSNYEDKAKSDPYYTEWRSEHINKLLNTIKLQRQQLAEQERKVWNEAIHKCLAQQFLARYSYQFLSDPDGEEKRGAIILVEYLEKLLKPESEVSGE